MSQSKSLTQKKIKLYTILKYLLPQPIYLFSQVGT